MLVDINLLPQKERKKSSFLILVLLVLVVLAAGGAYFGFLYQQGAIDEKGLEQQLASTQKLRELQEQNNVKSADSSAVEQLKSALAWAENYPVSTYEILNHLAGLLPERGFVMAFSYEDTGAVQLTIQFDTSREAAYYLRSLEDSEYVKEASLLSITTESITETEDGTSVDEDSEDVLPRYIAQYTVQVDDAAIKQAVNEREGE